MKPFLNNSAYVSQANAIGDNQPGFSMFQQPFPQPGQPSSANAPSNAQGNPRPAPAAVFSGRGVVVGESRTGYQGGSANSNSNYNVVQNVRDVPKGPNPLAQKSKLVQEHNQKSKKDNVHTNEDDLEGKPNQNSSESKDENEDLLNLN